MLHDASTHFTKHFLPPPLESYGAFLFNFCTIPAINHFPSEPSIPWYFFFVLKLESAVKITHGMTIRPEGNGRIIIPLEEQRPQIGIIFPEQTELIDPLVVAEPAAAASSRGIDRREQIILFTDPIAIRLRPADGGKGRNLAYAIQPCKAFRFINGNADVAYNRIFICALLLGAFGKFEDILFEFACAVRSPSGSEASDLRRGAIFRSELHQFPLIIGKP